MTGSFLEEPPMTPPVQARRRPRRWATRTARWRGAGSSQVSAADLAARGLSGDDTALSDQERAMAAWARKVVKDPNATTAADVQALRGTGLNDGQIFAITVFVALRLAFSSVTTLAELIRTPSLWRPCPKSWPRRSPTVEPPPRQRWRRERSRSRSELLQ